MADAFNFKEEFEGGMKNDADVATAESSPAEEKTEEKVEASQEEVEGLKSLDADEDFKKTVPQEYSKNDRWRKLYWQKKENERKYSEAEKRIKELEEKFAQENEDEELDIDERTLTQLAEQKGYTLTPKQKQEVAKVQDDLESLLSMAQTPEEKAWLEKYSNAMEKKVADGIGKNLSQVLGPMQEMIVEYRLDKSEKMARKYIEGINTKYGLKLDFDKDIDPELAKMVKANKSLTPDNVDIVKLTQMYLAENGIELGRKLSAKEMKEVNEKKKQSQVETEGTNAGPGDGEFRGIKEELKRAFDREGVTAWK